MADNNQTPQESPDTATSNIRDTVTPPQNVSIKNHADRPELNTIWDKPMINIDTTNPKNDNTK